MRKSFIRKSRLKLRGKPLTALFGLTVLAITGCSSPGSDDGIVINTDDRIELPTDTLLNLHCADVGIFPETCVLDDPENPYLATTIREFDVNDPDADTKFALFVKIPPGPSGAKSRFYLWATALARFPSGENQWYTALALHELWDAAEDPIVQIQALRAYRAVLDNFFGSVTFFNSEDFGLLPNVPYSVLLNELTAAQVTCSPIENYKKLIPLTEQDVFFGRAVLADWGYTYDFEGNCENGVVYVNEFP
ncbi:MAG: hypothetical protein OER85_06655 [Gammaproteobacteria bacterium]|nr:hypothetical protein [Gammaproteobacteria bacterium]